MNTRVLQIRIAEYLEAFDTSKTDIEALHGSLVQLIQDVLPTGMESKIMHGRGINEEMFTIAENYQNGQVDCEYIARWIQREISFCRHYYDIKL